MKEWMRRLFAITMALMLLLGMAGCNSGSPESTTAPPTETTVPEPTEDPQLQLAEAYLSAIGDVGTEDVGLQVKAWRYVTLAGQTYKQLNNTTIAYWNLGQEDFLAKVNDTTVFGNSDYSVAVMEIFSGDTLFQTIDKSKFKATLTQEEFTDRYVPVQLLDPDLYTITASEDGKILEFTDPVAGESWCVPEEATLVSANATVELDDAGKLTKTDYVVTYELGAAQIKLDYEVTMTVTGRQPVVPANVDAYVLLDDPDAAYILEHTYGYLSQVTHVSSDSSEVILCAAAGYVTQVTNDVDTYDIDGEYAAKWTTKTSAFNNYDGTEQEQELVEKFIDGKCTISQDGGRENPYEAITQSVMQDAVRFGLFSGVMEYSGIAASETTHLGAAILVEYTGTEDMGLELRDSICESIFQDKDVLNDLATSYKTNEMGFYVALDAYTLLPVAAGIQFEGVHVIQGQECILSVQADSSYDLASLTSYEEIFETSLDPEPEEKATPLFYHVTGAEGQEMWLLGTIHVGDERTAYLPDQIYDAFYASDALALEYDWNAFEAEVEKDEKLQKAVSNAYYYSDGTMLESHIVTEDLYADAEKMMKASGNYNQNAPYMKSYLWGTMIEEFKLRQGYLLTQDKGVDHRLSKLAEEEGIPIRSVEDSLEHVSLMGNYSDELQEVMLYSALATGTMEYVDSTLEMYEKWCAGDEAVLTEMVTDEEGWILKEEDFDLEGLDAEDLERAKAILADLDNINAQLAVLQAEYNEAMSTKRNAQMLAVAKEYLESGDTVFYAVGLAHLLVDDGLVNGLRAAGYTVELVQYS